MNDPDYKLLDSQLRALLVGETDALASASNFVALLFNTMGDVNWLGIYVLRGEELVLGPFQGKPACVPAERLERDGLLRSAASTPDMRYQLVSHAPTLESLLSESEATDLILQEAVDDGLLTSWQSVSQILPSQSRQQLRQNAIPDREDLHARLGDVLADTQFSPEAFEPFKANVESTRSLSPLLPTHFESRHWNGVLARTAKFRPVAPSPGRPVAQS